MKKMLIFDFDGTIADTLAATLQAYNEIAPRLGCKALRESDLERLKNGRPREMMSEFGVKPWKLPFLVCGVRHNMKSRMANLALHPGIAEALRELSSRNVTMGIVTTNSKRNVENFLKSHNLENIFSFITAHHHMFGKHKALRKIIALHSKEPLTVAYVGDEVRDIEAAKKTGIDAVAVTWGFQAKDALLAAQPAFTIDDPKELLELPYAQ